MPNIEILRKFDDSPLLEAIRSSNQLKIARDTRVSSKVEELATAGVK
jgi:hypothetical protein